MYKPLRGIKVIDWSTAGAGPSCTKLLSEYGADVVIVEPKEGTSTRAVFKMVFYNTGKRSIVLNLKTQEGMEIMMGLIQNADVFVSNYRTKALKKLGLTYERLKEQNPRLIYATLTGYGEEGPDADRPGYGPIAFWAKGGMLRDFAEKGSLLVPPIAVGDIAAGQALAGGVCAALYQREKTGRGEKISTSLLAQAAYLNHDAIIQTQYGDEYPKSRLEPRRALINSYQCSDGEWIVVTCVDFDKYFWKLLKAIGLDDLVGDSRWTCIEDTMYEHAPELVAILDEAFGKMTLNETAKALNSIDFPFNKVQSSKDMIHDPQSRANNYIFDIIAPTGETLAIPANPVKFTDKNSGVSDFRMAPELGEHTREVLKEQGYSDEEIDNLTKKGVIRQKP